MLFRQTYAHNPSATAINCTNISQHHFLQLLLMFVSYCLDVLKLNPPSIPGVLSALRHNLHHRLADCTVFDHPLIAATKAGVARLQSKPPRTRLPLTFAMVQWIIQRRTQPGYTPHDIMLATGVAMAYYLCLRSSEYVSRTVIPQDDSHQFDFESVEFACSNHSQFVPSHLMAARRWSEVTDMVCQCGSPLMKRMPTPSPFSSSSICGPIPALVTQQIRPFPSAHSQDNCTA